jgi:hypothetical protein
MERSAIRVSRTVPRWRICFEWREAAAWNVEIVDYLQARHDLEAADQKLRRRIEREVWPRAA